MNGKSSTGRTWGQGITPLNWRFKPLGWAFKMLKLAYYGDQIRAERRFLILRF